MLNQTEQKILEDNLDFILTNPQHITQDSYITAYNTVYTYCSTSTQTYNIEGQAIHQLIKQKIHDFTMRLSFKSTLIDISDQFSMFKQSISLLNSVYSYIERFFIKISSYKSSDTERLSDIFYNRIYFNYIYSIEEILLALIFLEIETARSLFKQECSHLKNVVGFYLDVLVMNDQEEKISKFYKLYLNNFISHTNFDSEIGKLLKRIYLEMYFVCNIIGEKSMCKNIVGRLSCRENEVFDYVINQVETFENFKHVFKIISMMDDRVKIRFKKACEDIMRNRFKSLSSFRDVCAFFCRFKRQITINKMVGYMEELDKILKEDFIDRSSTVQNEISKDFVNYIDNIIRKVDKDIEQSCNPYTDEPCEHSGNPCPYEPHGWLSRRSLCSGVLNDDVDNSVGCSFYITRFNSELSNIFDNPVNNGIGDNNIGDNNNGDNNIGDNNIADNNIGDNNIGDNNIGDNNNGDNNTINDNILVDNTLINNLSVDNTLINNLSVDNITNTKLPAVKGIENNIINLDYLISLFGLIFNEFLLDQYTMKCQRRLLGGSSPLLEKILLDRIIDRVGLSPISRLKNTVTTYTVYNSQNYQLTPDSVLRVSLLKHAFGFWSLEQQHINLPTNLSIYLYNIIEAEELKYKERIHVNYTLSPFIFQLNNTVYKMNSDVFSILMHAYEQSNNGIIPLIKLKTISDNQEFDQKLLILLNNGFLELLDEEAYKEVVMHTCSNNKNGANKLLNKPGEEKHNEMFMKTCSNNKISISKVFNKTSELKTHKRGHIHSKNLRNENLKKDKKRINNTQTGLAMNWTDNLNRIENKALDDVSNDAIGIPVIEDDTSNKLIRIVNKICAEKFVDLFDLPDAVIKDEIICPQNIEKNAVVEAFICNILNQSKEMENEALINRLSSETMNYSIEDITESIDRLVNKGYLELENNLIKYIP